MELRHPIASNKIEEPVIIFENEKELKEFESIESASKWFNEYLNIDSIPEDTVSTGIFFDETFKYKESIYAFTTDKKIKKAKIEELSKQNEKVKPTGYWTFFCNPQKWAIDDFLESDQIEDTFSITRWQKDWFKKGQFGVIRVGHDHRSKEQLNGNEKLGRGIYAVVEIIGDVVYSADVNDKHYYDKSNKQSYRVPIKYIRNLLKKPLLLDELILDEFKYDNYLIRGFQASSMPLSSQTFERILGLVDREGDNDMVGPYNTEDVIGKESWLELLKDKEIFREDNLIMLKKMYEQGGDATATELAAALEKHNSAFNAPVVALAKRIYKKTSIESFIGKDGKKSYWSVLFTGKVEPSGFRWFIKENLYKALEEYIHSEDVLIYAITKWRKDCLIKDKSLIWPGDNIWTKENISKIDQVFVSDPDISDATFDDKFKLQLENESEFVYKLAIELLFVYYLFPTNSSVSYDTKIAKIGSVASWKGIDLDLGLPIFEALKEGLGSTGIFFNTQKYHEISFLILTVKKLKEKTEEERIALLKDDIKFKKLTKSIRIKIGKRVQSQNIILHLLFPDKFERMSSTGDKDKIIKAFSYLISDENVTDVDQQIYVIREKLEEKYGEKIDFYHNPEILKQWKPPVEPKPEIKLNHFWITLNQSRWPMENYPVDSTITIPSENEKGQNRKGYILFEKAKMNDLVILYSTSPNQVVFARGQITKDLPKKTDEDFDKEKRTIDIKIVEYINPIPWIEIVNHSLLKNSDVAEGQGREAIFNLTKPEYESLIDWKPDPSGVPKVDFNVKGNLEGLIFEDKEILMNQIMTALGNGKHIILTGPPGTGKSKLASIICDIYKVNFRMVTASSNWSTFDTIGGYLPDKEGDLYFNDGIFLNCVRDQATQNPDNRWLIIDEINRADIDKAFGSLFSVLTGDEILLPFDAENGQKILLKPQIKDEPIESEEHIYTIPADWRIIATMNTIDKASLYEMSYAFMRRFAFIPVGIPKKINAELIGQYMEVWQISDYPHAEVIAEIWNTINEYRKIGPAIIEDVIRHTQISDNFTSALILYVLPQFEGLPVHKIEEFIKVVSDKTDAINFNQLNEFINDFFKTGTFE